MNTRTKTFQPHNKNREYGTQKTKQRIKNGYESNEPIKPKITNRWCAKLYDQRNRRTVLKMPLLGLIIIICVFYLYRCGPGSSVGIATGYGLDGPGIESWWGRDFPQPVQTGPGVHPASCTMGTGSFPGVESGRGVTLTPHPLLVPRSKNIVELYLYSP
jgi:hypothetical protein